MSAARAHRRLATMAVTAGMALALLFATTLLACGSKDRGLSDQAAADLQAGVARVRAAAVGGDRAGASGQLAALRGAVDRHRSQGQISAGRAADVLAAAGEVEARLALLAAPPPTTATPNTTTTVRRAPTSPGRGEDDEGDQDKKGGGKKDED